MFHLRVGVESIECTGLKSLDLRRHFGLADDSRMRIVNSGYTEIKVSEHFARKHFGEQETVICFYVSFPMLQRGEIVPVDNSTCFKISDSIPVDRVLELFHQEFNK